MFEELSSKDPKVKYGAAKALLAAAKNDPSSLYPHLDFLISLLDSDNNIFKWTAIDVVGRLATVDAGERLNEIVMRLFSFLNAGNMITANHSISALAECAAVHPALRRTITEELLKVEHYNYETDECRNIAMGKVILALDSYPLYPPDEKSLTGFVERQTRNTRNATAKKAQAFLKKLRRGELN